MIDQPILTWGPPLPSFDPQSVTIDFAAGTDETIFTFAWIENGEKRRRVHSLPRLHARMRRLGPYFLKDVKLTALVPILREEPDESIDERLEAMLNDPRSYIEPPGTP